MNVQEILDGKPELRTIPGIACKNHDIVYCSIPKAGCTTIKNMLYYIDHGEYYRDPIMIHEDPDALYWPMSTDRAAYIKAMERRKVTFTIVREPFARAYSAFNEKIFEEGRFSFPSYRRTLTEHYGARFPDPGEPYGTSDHADNFAKFLRLVRDGLRNRAKSRWNPHWAPQTQLIGLFTRHITIDLIGRIEALEPAMRYVMEVAGVSCEIDYAVRFNEGPKPPYRLHEIMTPAILELLAEIYGKDVANFGYGLAVEAYRGSMPSGRSVPPL